MKNGRSFSSRLLKAAFSLCCIQVAALGAQTLDEARNLVSEWVGVEKTISEEKADWEAGQTIIKDMIALLETEKASLTEKIRIAEEGLSESDKKLRSSSTKAMSTGRRWMFSAIRLEWWKSG